MEIEAILLGSGFVLTLVLVVFLVLLISKRNGQSNRKDKKVSKDIEKIKDQINGK